LRNIIELIYRQGRRNGGAWRGHCPLPFEKGNRGTGALI